MMQFSLIASQTENTCPNVVESTALPEESGQLLYVPSDVTNTEILTTTEMTLTVPSIYSDLAISPNGIFLVNRNFIGIENERTVYELVVLDMTNGDIYQSTFDIWTNRNIDSLIWMNNSEILIVWSSRTSPPEIYPYEIINPFTGENQVAEYRGIGTSPSILGFLHFGETFNISPNGEYAVFSNFIIYDIGNREIIVDLAYFDRRLGAWSPDSQQLALFGRSSREVAYNIFIYDLNTDSVTQATFFEEDDVNFFGSGLTTTSWSPNIDYLAFSFGLEDGHGQIQIVNLATSEIIETCLMIRGTAFARYNPDANMVWSRDGRYLAVDGALMGENIEEDRGIFLYDLVENQIIQIYETQAEIIGWAVVQ